MLSHVPFVLASGILQEIGPLPTLLNARAIPLGSRTPPSPSKLQYVDLAQYTPLASLLQSHRPA